MKHRPDRVVAEEGGEQAAHRWEVRDPLRVRVRNAVSAEAVVERRRQRRRRPTMIRLKKIPIESTMAEFMKVAAMPAPAPR